VIGFDPLTLDWCLSISFTMKDISSLSSYLVPVYIVRDLGDNDKYIFDCESYW